MRRLSPLAHPVLLAIFPVLSLFQHNQAEIALSLVWKPLALSAVAGAALFVIFRLVLKRDAQAGVVASLVVVAFFYYGFFYGHVSGWGLSDAALLPLWIALLVLGVAAVVRTNRDLTNVSWALNVLALVLVLIPATKVVTYRVQHPPVSISDPRLWPTPLPKPALARGASRPDIYYIIPDDYARGDVLKQQFGYDNSDFLRQLEERGFVIADHGRSPYSKSEFNMASALNLDYLSSLPNILGKNSEDVLLVRNMIDDNRASHLLKSLGYRYTHLDSDNITFEADNPHISPLAAPDNLTYVWLRNSILRTFGGRYGFNEGATDTRFRQSVRSVFDQLGAVADDPTPKFVVFHTLLPHDPYIFGPHGENMTFPDHSDTGHSTRRGMKYYVKQLHFVNTKLLEATDAILAHSKTPPIIMIQADEGFEALPEEFVEKVVQNMRVKGLSAFYLPGKDKARLPQDLNVVNSFRFVFNEYFDTHFNMFPSVSYPEGDHAYEFVKMPDPDVAG